MKSTTLTTNMRVTRKRDGATGTIVKRELVVPSGPPPPGIYGKTLVTIRFDHGGFDSTGDVGWFRSNFKVN